MVDLGAILRKALQVLKNEDPPEAPEMILLIEEKVWTPPPDWDGHFAAIGVLLRIKNIRPTASIEHRVGVGHGTGPVEEKTWKEPAYEVTFKAVVEESFLTELLWMSQDHEVLAMVGKPSDRKGGAR